MTSNFSKKHYIQIAEVLSKVRLSLREDFSDSVIDVIAMSRVHDSLSQLFQYDNPNFNSEKFEEAIYKNDLIEEYLDVRI